MAFGWLPKETINLDISMCVCVCERVRVCVGMCLCVLLRCEWEIIVALFYCTQTQVWAKADQSENMRKHATMQLPASSAAI